MAKPNPSNRLVRSDQRLMALGLFAAAAIFAVTTLFKPSLLMLAPQQPQVTERTIKIEEVPVGLESQLQNVEDSFAAEPFDEDMSVNEGSPSGYMQDHSNQSESY